MADRPLDASTRLAAERTRLAHERTLMAWIRTCTSLIAFGFTIVGLTGLTLAWFQHRREMKALEAELGTMPYSISGIMAGLIAGLGLIALVAVILRL